MCLNTFTQPHPTQIGQSSTLGVFMTVESFLLDIQVLE